MIRMYERLYLSIVNMAAMHDRSINSEICHAVDQWAHPRSNTRMICHLLGVQFESGGAPPILALSNLDHQACDIKKIMIRFTDDQLQLIREYSHAKKQSMNGQFNAIVAWWISTNLELERLLATHRTPR